LLASRGNPALYVPFGIRGFEAVTWLGGVSGDDTERTEQRQSLETSGVPIRWSRRAKRRTPPTDGLGGRAHTSSLLDLVGARVLLLRPLSTDARVLERGSVARYPAVLKPGDIGPLVRLLRPPRPHDPPARLFERNHLRLPHLPQERLVVLAERRARPGQTRAAADAARSRVRAVVARADAPSVEVLGAVRHRGRPLPGDGPQLVCIEVLEGAAQATRSTYMFRLILRYALADREPS
jgi:hypothetical protein